MEAFKKYWPLIVIAIVGYFLVKKVSSSSSGNITTNLTTVTPNTAAANQPMTDPLLPYRAQAFGQLTSAAIAQTQAETAKANQAAQIAVQSKALDVQASGQQIQAQTQAAGITAQLQQYLAGLANQLQLGLRGYSTQENIAGIAGQASAAQTQSQSDLAKYLQSAQVAQQQALQNSYLQQLQLYYQQRENDRQAQQAAINRTQSNQRTNSIIGSIGSALGGLFGGGGFNSGSIFTPPTFPTNYYDTNPYAASADNVPGGLLGGGGSLFDNGFGGLF
jgi:hypothetical protein